ncbi:MAG TPA: hypothetical protein VF444_11985 [Pseudonocardiaceae bacterium]
MTLSKPLSRPLFSRPTRVLASGVLAAVLLAAPVLAGCSNNQPGNANNGPGYSNNVTDLATKVEVYSLDPCRGAQAGQDFPNCGRFVGEVSSALGSLRSQLPGDADVTAAQNAVNSYLGLGCGALTGAPTATQRTDCPRALVAIGHALDGLKVTLAKDSSTTPS